MLNEVGTENLRKITAALAIVRNLGAGTGLDGESREQNCGAEKMIAHYLAHETTHFRGTENPRTLNDGGVGMLVTMPVSASSNRIPLCSRVSPRARSMETSALA